MIYHRITQNDLSQMVKSSRRKIIKGGEIIDWDLTKVKNPSACLIIIGGDTKILSYSPQGFMDGTAILEQEARREPPYHDSDDLRDIAEIISTSPKAINRLKKLTPVSSRNKINLEDYYKYSHENHVFLSLYDIYMFLNGEDSYNKIYLYDHSQFLQHGYDVSSIFVFDLDKNVLEVFRGRNTKPLSKKERFYSNDPPKPYHTSLTFSNMNKMFYYENVRDFPSVLDDERLFYPPKSCKRYSMEKVPSDLEVCFDFVKKTERR